MTKRESGWYRVFNKLSGWELVKFEEKSNSFDINGELYTEINLLNSGDFIDPQMVMTPSGQIVYNHPAHDPLYNTKQEG